MNVLHLTRNVNLQREAADSSILSGFMLVILYPLKFRQYQALVK